MAIFLAPSRGYSRKQNGAPAMLPVCEAQCEFAQKLKQAPPKEAHSTKCFMKYFSAQHACRRTGGMSAVRSPSLLAANQSVHFLRVWLGSGESLIIFSPCSRVAPVGSQCPCLGDLGYCGSGADFSRPCGHSPCAASMSTSSGTIASPAAVSLRRRGPGRFYGRTSLEGKGEALISTRHTRLPLRPGAPLRSRARRRRWRSCFRHGRLR